MTGRLTEAEEADAVEADGLGTAAITKVAEASASREPDRINVILIVVSCA
jgi:hypothetical protein